MDSFKELSNIDSEITLEIEELILYGNVDKNTTNPNTGKRCRNTTTNALCVVEHSNLRHILK